MNYKLLGTSHVAQESVEQIEQAVKDFKPDVVCIELDKNRLHGLLSKETTKMSPKLIFELGLWGYLFGLAGQYAQKTIGKKLDITPGKDMLTAFQVAQKHNLKVALIDQNVRVTLKRVSKLFSFRERTKLVGSIFSGLIFRKRAVKKFQKELGTTDLDLSKVPSGELIVKMIGILEKEYPGLYKALVDERNHVMVNRMVGLYKKYPESKFLVVVGAGHVEGMEKLLKGKLQNILIVPKRINTKEKDGSKTHAQ
jgi:pheromone shutdown protein TraB